MENITTARLRFLCRRGMKEVEAILQPFFDQHYASLNPKLQQDFAKLLDQEEPTLWDWLVTKQGEVPEEFKEIVKEINESTT